MKNTTFKITNATGLICAFAISLSLFTACDSGTGTQQTHQDSTATEENIPAKNPDGQVLVRGTVIKVSATQVELKSEDSTVTVKLSQPFHLYDRQPGSMADIKNDSFVGVTSVKQADGTDQATEVHIFPEELRGLGEGSYMMNTNAGPGNNRMTNGSVSASRMTNGTAATQSRMSNGSVKSKGASTLEVQFQGHTRNITIPPKTSVTELKPATGKLTAGMPVALMAKKDAAGALIADKGVVTKK